MKKLLLFYALILCLYSSELFAKDPNPGNVDQLWYADADGDNYGNPSVTLE